MVKRRIGATELEVTCEEADQGGSGLIFLLAWQLPLGVPLRALLPSGALPERRVVLEEQVDVDGGLGHRHAGYLPFIEFIAHLVREPGDELELFVGDGSLGSVGIRWREHSLITELRLCGKEFFNPDPCPLLGDVLSGRRDAELVREHLQGEKLLPRGRLGGLLVAQMLNDAISVDAARPPLAEFVADPGPPAEQQESGDEVSGIIHSDITV